MATAEEITIQERRIKALRLKKAGKSYREIGELLGVSHTTASNDVKAALESLAEHEQAAEDNDELSNRRQRALELRKKGDTYREIGKALNVSHTTAAKDVKAALEELQRVERLRTEEYRQLMAERINMARKSLVDKVMNGDEKAIDRWIRLNEQEIKLFGLNEPQMIGFTFQPELVAALQVLGLDPDTAFDHFQQLIFQKARQAQTLQ